MRNYMSEIWAMNEDEHIEQWMKLHVKFEKYVPVLNHIENYRSYIQSNAGQYSFQTT